MGAIEPTGVCRESIPSRRGSRTDPTGACGRRRSGKGGGDTELTFARTGTTRSARCDGLIRPTGACGRRRSGKGGGDTELTFASTGTTRSARCDGLIQPESGSRTPRWAPKAWPKWTYGPRGERCWYSGQKPFFPKEMPAQAEVIRAPFSYAPTDTRLQAGSNKAQSPPCLASAAEVRQLTPNAWPKWTYGPRGERCWYSGEKPVFAKTR